MNKINLLVIDDENVQVNRQMDELRSHDTSGILGEIKIFSTFPDDIEKLDLSHYVMTKEEEVVDAVLIDYDLNSKYSGTLISAWLALRNQYIPRIAFTTRNYTGEANDFDGYVLKNDIVDNPKSVISGIVEIVEKSNVEGWVDKKYLELIDNFSVLCEKRLREKLTHTEELTLDLLTRALDSMDKQFDRQIEKSIDLKFRMADKQYHRIEFLKSSISEIDDQINEILTKIEKSEE